MISCENVQKYFNNKNEKIVALDDVCFDVNEGEFLGYLGTNGSGKTTTMKLITGIIRPSEGKVRVLGKDPFLKRKEIAYHIGVVFGNRSTLWPELSIYDTLSLVSKFYKISKADFKQQTEFLWKN